MMEFEEEHEEEEEEEEEEEDSDMAITPTFRKPASAAAATVRYRECLKNHAVGIGGHAVDGCGEFLPAGAEGSIDALRCAACNCHRNFHRKEFTNSAVISSQQLTLYTTPHHRPPHHHHPHQIYQFYPYNRTTAGYHLHVSGQRPLALPSPTSGGGTHSGRDNNNNNHHHQHQHHEVAGGGGGGGGEQMMMMTNNEVMTNPVGGGGTLNMSMDISGGGGTMLSGGGNTSTSSGKKRFRTKFTPEQKDKMLVLAERLGWRIQKQDDEVVHQFCQQTGVKRHVLKVWMHNNKHTLGKKTLSTSTTPPPP